MDFPAFEAWLFGIIKIYTGWQADWGTLSAVITTFIGGCVGAYKVWKWATERDTDAGIARLAAEAKRQADESRLRDERQAEETRLRDEADKRDLQRQLQDMAAEQKKMAEMFRVALGAKLETKLAAEPQAAGSVDQSSVGITKDLNAAVATLVAGGKGAALADKTGADAKAALKAMIDERATARATVETARSTIAADEATLWRQYGALAFLNDTADGIAAYTRATELDPDDAEGWNQLGHLLERTGDLDDAQRAYGRVLALGETRQDRTLIAVASGNLGNVLQTRGDLDGAEAMYRKALVIDEALGRKEGMASDYGNLGIVLETRGDLDGAEAMYLKSLVIDEALGRKEGMANQYGNLGNVLKTRGDLDGAEAMYRKALVIDEALGRKEGMASDYGNLGIVLKTRGDLDGAEAMYRKSLAIDEALGRKEGMAIQYGNLGAVLETRGDLDGAEAMYRKALVLNEALGRKEGMASVYGNLGNVLQARGDLAGACAYWRKARDLYREIGAKPMEAQLDGWLKQNGCGGAGGA